jgi:hypothetical protein
MHVTDEAILAAVSRLSIEQRRNLIDKLDDIPRFDTHILEALIANDVLLFQHLLGRKSGQLKVRHLVPLKDGHSRSFGGDEGGYHGPPDPTWVEMAQFAMDEGYTESDVAEAVLHSGFGWTGSESDAWRRKAERWGELELTDDPGIKSLGRRLRDTAMQYSVNAARRERIEGVWERIG